MKVFISPAFRGADRGDGGIRRVVEAQHRWLPTYGVEIAETASDCDVAAFHAGVWEATDAPVVAHCHGLYWSGYPWARWALRLNDDVIRTLKGADAITAPSEWVAQALRRGLWAAPTVLYHGIEPDEWAPGGGGRGKGERYVLWNKSRVDAICDPAAVNELAVRAPDVPFISTYGDVGDNVTITGTLPYAEAQAYVRDAGVYLCTARETFGIGTLEAMACGVPVLGWRWGGQAEFVIHKKHGYLATPGDFDDLLAGLRFCLAGRLELGRMARRYVLENFTWQKRIKGYADLYKGVYEASVGRPKVSVVITNYNLGRFLPAAVESARQEVSGGVEIVVVDDASTEPLPPLAGVDVLIRNEKNLYLAEALNVGVQAARGKYIVPLDADNLLTAGSLETLSQALDGSRGLDIAYGRMKVIQDGEVFVSSWPPAEASLDEQLAHRNQISSTAMYRRRIWSRIGGYRRRCHTAEDADFWTRALGVGAVGRRVTDAVCFIYRDRRDSMSHVQPDWAWHEWYRAGPRLFGAGGLITTHERPEISVVIPVGVGHERLVLDALDSVHNQTFGSWEAIVVDDTGGGGSMGWLPSWAAVVTSGGRGAASARNLGLATAIGKYVLFLDADDWLHPEALALMLAVAEKRGGFVYSDWFVGETGEVKQLNDFDPDAVLHQLPYGVTCLYNRADLLDRDIWFDVSWDGVGWEDWDFALQVVARGGLCGTRIPAPLFHYRLRSGTLRDKAYVERDDLKQQVWAKWSDYVTGKVENMARGCGCGGSGFVQRQLRPGDVLVQPNTQAGAAGAGEAVVLLEYTGEDEGSFRTFIGRVTGTRYRFGSGEFKVRRVYTSDKAVLLGMGLFREIDGLDVTSFTPLEAKGPPEVQPPRELVGAGAA